MTAAEPTEPRNRESGRRLQLAAHLLLSVVMVALGVWAGLRWSLIAVEVDARITTTAWAEEGPDFKVVVLEGDRALTIDDGLMDRMGEPDALIGQELRHEPMSATLHINGRVVDLLWSSTATRATLLLGAIAVVGIARTRRAEPRRSVQQVSPNPPSD